MGGFWGPELKFAGYDNLIIRGKSPSWVYLWINNDKVEFRDASHLLGKGIRETTELLKQELKDDRAQVACIGPAGENKVVMASIEASRASAAKGAGVIMGDKKLKAIVVRGTKHDINIAHPAELFEYCSGLMKRWLEHPEVRGRKAHSQSPEGGFGAFHLEGLSWGNSRERRRGFWNEDERKNYLELEKKYMSGLMSCYNCPNGCVDVVNYPGIPPYFLKCWSIDGYRMGAMSDFDFELKICGIAHDYGMDSWSTPLVVALGLELYDAGILTDKDMPGIPSDQTERFEWLLHKIVRREGIGDILANGSYWAARQIGGEAIAYDHSCIRKEENHPIKLGFLNYTYYLQWATNEKKAITQIQGPYPQDPRPTREQREEFVKSWDAVPYQRLVDNYLVWEPRGHESIQHACDVCDYNETTKYWEDALGLCKFWASTGGYHLHTLPKIISLATGMDMDEAELWKIAHRNRNLLRGINARLGWNRSLEEQIPEDHWSRREPEVEKQLLDEYYAFKGWNDEGIPTRETLHNLDLDYVAEDLERRGILKKETLVREAKFPEGRGILPKDSLTRTGEPLSIATLSRRVSM